MITIKWFLFLSGSQVPTQTGHELSSYPAIDRFVLSVVNRGGVQGEIRKWAHFAQGTAQHP